MTPSAPAAPASHLSVVANAYVVCRHAGPTHCAALICRAYSGTHEFSAAALEGILGQTARKNFFVEKRVSIEIQGL